MSTPDKPSSRVKRSRDQSHEAPKLRSWLVMESPYLHTGPGCSSHSALTDAVRITQQASSTI